MIPEYMQFQKPIDLRHICLFYLGHIPTFLDIHLTRLLEEPHTDPQEFKDIFEVRSASSIVLHFFLYVTDFPKSQRGIDPNVDDPSKCHVSSFETRFPPADCLDQDHSEVPQADEDWPKLETIIDFQSRVRRRLSQLYDDIHSGKTLTRKIGRVLQMTYEHEALHTEVSRPSVGLVKLELIFSLY